MSAKRTSAKKSRPKSENALKHGAYARAVLLPHESRRDYERLVAETRIEWSPSGPTEEHLVARLIDKLWRLERLRRYEDQLLQRRIEQVQEQNSIAPVRGKLKALGPEFVGAITADQVEQLLAKHGEYGKVIAAWVPRPKETDKEGSWGAAIAEHLKKMEVGPIVEGPSEILTYVDPFKLELQEDRMERLDEEILKLTKRLVQVKTSKELFRPRNDPAKLAPVNEPRPALTIDHQGDVGKTDSARTSKQKLWVPEPSDYRSRGHCVEDETR